MSQFGHNKRIGKKLDFQEYEQRHSHGINIELKKIGEKRTKEIEREAKKARRIVRRDSLSGRAGYEYIMQGK